jgi:hypothetical protein
MRSLILTSLLLSLTLPLVSAWGQDAPTSGSTELQTEMRRKRLMIRPVPDPQLAIEDAARAQTGQQRQATQEELVREVTRDVVTPYTRRPDLDPAVVRGTQQRNLDKIGR